MSTSNQGAEKPHFNTAQTVLLRSYSRGDLQHILEAGSQAEVDVELASCGDGLLRYLMVELSDKEDCKDLDEAVHRVSKTIEDLEALRLKLEREAAV